MARPEKYVPPEDRNRICYLNKDLGWGPRRIAEDPQLKGKYNYSRIGRIVKKCPEVTGTIAGLQAIVNEPAPSSTLNFPPSILQAIPSPDYASTFTGGGPWVPQTDSPDITGLFTGTYTQSQISTVSPLENPMGTLLNYTTEKMGEKANKMLWEAADAIADRMLGIQHPKPQTAESPNTTTTAKTDPYTQYVIQKAQKFLEENEQRSRENAQTSTPNPAEAIDVTQTEPSPAPQHATTDSPTLVSNPTPPAPSTITNLDNKEANMERVEPVGETSGTSTLTEDSRSVYHGYHDSSNQPTTVNVVCAMPPKIEPAAAPRVDQKGCSCDCATLRDRGTNPPVYPTPPPTPEAPRQSDLQQMPPNQEAENHEAQEEQLIQAREPVNADTPSSNQRVDQEVRAGEAVDERPSATPDGSAVSFKMVEPDSSQPPSTTSMPQTRSATTTNPYSTETVPAEKTSQCQTLPPSQQDEGSIWPWILAGGVVVVGGYVAYELWKDRRSQQTEFTGTTSSFTSADPTPGKLPILF